MCQEKKEEVKTPVFRILKMHQYKDYIKKSKDRLINAVSNNIGIKSTDRKSTKSRKQNCMYI